MCEIKCENYSKFRFCLLPLSSWDPIWYFGGLTSSQGLLPSQLDFRHFSSFSFISDYETTFLPKLVRNTLQTFFNFFFFFQELRLVAELNEWQCLFALQTFTRNIKCPFSSWLLNLVCNFSVETCFKWPKNVIFWNTCFYALKHMSSM